METYSWINPEVLYLSEEADCLHLFLDSKNISRSDNEGTLSLVGRVVKYKEYNEPKRLIL